VLCKELTDTKGNIRSSCYIQLHLSVCITHALQRENSGEEDRPRIDKGHKSCESRYSM
jgi:hypothetical protein